MLPGFQALTLWYDIPKYNIRQHDDVTLSGGGHYTPACCRQASRGSRRRENVVFYGTSGWQAVEVRSRKLHGLHACMHACMHACIAHYALLVHDACWSLISASRINVRKYLSAWCMLGKAFAQRMPFVDPFYMLLQPGPDHLCVQTIRITYTWTTQMVKRIIYIYIYTHTLCVRTYTYNMQGNYIIYIYIHIIYSCICVCVCVYSYI